MVWKCPQCNEVVDVVSESSNPKRSKKKHFKRGGADGRCSRCGDEEANHVGIAKYCTQNALESVEEMQREEEATPQSKLVSYFAWTLSVMLIITGCILLILMAAKTPKLDSTGRMIVGLVSTFLLFSGLTLLVVKLRQRFSRDLLCASCLDKKRSRQSLLALP
mmetsp:Transcript_55592/g.113631  ORF Transcript_55592/g.113631 Transcript_55592/m.113631 type:complete len:163 (+) Transcript_55592:66-554(+)